MNNPSKPNRGGAAAIEAALVLPVLVILTLGAIDISQYINLSQVVANTSREGARMISRHETKSTTDAENTIRAHIKGSYPQLTDAQVAASTKIAIRDKNNQPIAGGDLTKIDTGDLVSCDVAFDFSAIRWLDGPSWNGNSSQCKTVFRRE